jgi:methylmalonyl-CoA/ethylmalonyl-CoA epimerase
VRPPPLRVDHVSIAVDTIEPALALFRRVLPAQTNVAPRAGYDDQFRWTDFLVGDFKIELIESARPGSFVERFLARRGEGFHHLSIDVADGELGRWVGELEAAGLRIVDRGDYGNGDETAFISPRSTPGILVQFWQVPGFDGRGLAPSAESIAERDGVRFHVDHLSIAVRSIDATLAWFRRFFPVEPRRPNHRGWDGSFRLASFWIAGYKIELIEPARDDAPVARFLAERGEGFHHLAVHVDRLDPLVERLRDEGLRIIGEATIGGERKTAFLHPRDAHGILLQFWQEPGLGDAPER